MTARFADPKANVLQLGLHDGMTIADLGSGPGAYALAASAVIGDDGRVYAVDVQEDVLANLAESAKHLKRKNIETVWGNIENVAGTKLKDGIVDAAILSNILFQLEKRDGAVAEAKRILKPGGKLLVIDWAGSYDGMGPPADKLVSEHQAEELFIGAGFHKAKSFRAGPHHYGIVFTKP